MEEDQGTHTLWEQKVIEEKQNMQMLVDKIWFLMSEMNRGPGYHIQYITARVYTQSRPRGLDKWTLSTYKIKIVPQRCTVTELEGSTYPTFNRFPDLIELATTGPNL